MRNNQQTSLSGGVRRTVMDRAARGADQEGVVNAVFKALVEADVNPRTVSLEDWKQLVFDAFQAARNRDWRLAG